MFICDAFRELIFIFLGRRLIKLARLSSKNSGFAGFNKTIEVKWIFVNDSSLNVMTISKEWTSEFYTLNALKWL